MPRSVPDPAGVAPAHGVLQRPGAKPALRLLELPPWHGWTWRSEAARAARWIQSTLVIPTGVGAGSRFRLARFQRDLIDDIYGSLALFASLPTANAKTTLLAAVALERACRGDDYVEVDVVATKEDQAGILVEQAKRMVECCPELVPLCAWHSKEGMLEYRPTGSRIAAHPAKLSAIQGLDFTLAVVDEIGFASDDVVESMVARLGKRPDAHVVGIGTPGFDPNVLHRIRADAQAGVLPAGVRYREWSAPPGCDLLDRRAWRLANPGVAAGFLRVEALELQAGLLPERAFRTYHLGQWVDTSAGWLPAGAWDACPSTPPPPDGAEVVVGVEGTYRRTLAVVGCGLDGSLFMVWAAAQARDDELRGVLDAVMARWQVREVVFNRRIRPGLFAELGRNGAPVAPWGGGADLEAASANEFYRAVVDGRVVHDHDTLVGEHMGGVAVRWQVDGSLRLTRPEDGREVDAALAARAAWWRAGQLAVEPVPEAPAVF